MDMETSSANEAADADIARSLAATASAARVVARTTEIGQREPATDQSPAKPFASSRQPALHRPDGAMEVTRRLLVGTALDVAQHDRHPEAVGEAVDLRVDHGGELIAAELVPVRIPHRNRPPLGRPPPTGRHAGADRGAAGDPMEPRTERVAHPERAGLPHQDQKGGLEGVLGVVVVAEDRAADPPDHRPVPLDQGREGRLGRLAAAGGESLQQLTVGESSRRPRVEEHAEGRGSGSVMP
jgi:hypothetical protein